MSREMLFGLSLGDVHGTRTLRADEGGIVYPVEGLAFYTIYPNAEPLLARAGWKAVWLGNEYRLERLTKEPN